MAEQVLGKPLQQLASNVVQVKAASSPWVTGEATVNWTGEFQSLFPKRSEAAPGSLAGDKGLWLPTAAVAWAVFYWLVQSQTSSEIWGMEGTSSCTPRDGPNVV